MSFQLTYRNQWPGTGDFVTYDGAFFATSQNLKSTSAFYISKDIQGQGIISTTEIALLYGYRTHLNRTLEFSAGIQGTYSFYSMDIESLNFENDFSPDIPDNRSNSYFDFSSGIELDLNKKYRIGFSVSNILAKSTALNRKYSLSYHGNYSTNKSYGNKSLQVQPMLTAIFQKDRNEFLYGGRLAYLNIFGGLYLRQDFAFHFDSFIILLGTSFANTSFFYTYDINLSGADSVFTNLAAHEVTFLQKIEYNKKRKKKRAIKCPKI